MNKKNEKNTGAKVVGGAMAGGAALGAGAYGVISHLRGAESDDEQDIEEAPVELIESEEGTAPQPVNTPITGQDIVEPVPVHGETTAEVEPVPVLSPERSEPDVFIEAVYAGPMPDPEMTDPFFVPEPCIYGPPTDFIDSPGDDDYIICPEDDNPHIDFDDMSDGFMKDFDI